LKEDEFGGEIRKKKKRVDLKEMAKVNNLN
jgi:hypothetical protein